MDEAKIHSFITVPFSKNQYPIYNLFQSNSNFKTVTDQATWIDLLFNGQALILGTLSQMDLYMMYDQKKVNQETLQLIQYKLQSINVDVINSTGELEHLLSGNKHQLFPVE